MRFKFDDEVDEKMELWPLTICYLVMHQYYFADVFNFIFKTTRVGWRALLRRVSYMKA